MYNMDILYYAIIYYTIICRRTEAHNDLTKQETTNLRGCIMCISLSLSLYICIYIYIYIYISRKLL